MTRRGTVISAPAPKRVGHVVSAPATPKGGMRGRAISDSSTGGWRRYRDPAIGIAGTVLLLVAAALVVTLPETVVPNPQFRIDILSDAVELPTQEHVFQEGESHDFSVDIPEGTNLESVQVELGWTDDFAASDPDRFSVELIDPSGATVFKGEFQNPRGEPESSNGGLTMNGVPYVGGFTYRYKAQPSAAIVEGTHPDETAEDAARRVLPDYLLGGGGSWRIRVTLLDAGDCEVAAPAGPRLPACVNDPQNPGGADDGNAFSVAKVIYSSYEPVLTALE